MPTISRSPNNAQTKNQEWSVTVKAVSNKVVYIRFLNNYFRKHFVLPSKKLPVATPQETKISNKALNRYMITDREALRNPEINTREKKRKTLENRYNFGTSINHVIDLSKHDLDSVLAEMCTSLAKSGADWDEDTVNEITFNFTVPCVIATQVSIESNVAKIDHSAATSSISMNVKKDSSNPLSFSINH